MGLFEQSKIWITTGEMFAFYKAIHEISGDLGIGLKLGSEERIERYDPIAIAALYTRSFRDAPDRMARYKRLTCPEEIRIEEHANECAVRFVWLLAGEPEPVTLIDVCFAWIVAIGRRGIGHTVNPRRVEFKRPESNRRLYEDHFRCPVKFGARHNMLLFHGADLAQPDAAAAAVGGAHHLPEPRGGSAARTGAALPARIFARTERDRVSAGI